MPQKKKPTKGNKTEAKKSKPSNRKSKGKVEATSNIFIWRNDLRSKAIN